MLYEINETEFFDVLKIKEVKTYSYLLDIINQNNYLLKVDLNYYDEDYNECYQLLELPITLSENDYLGDAKLKSVDLEVIEANGINLHFILEVDLPNESFSHDDSSHDIKEEIKNEYDNLLEENLDREEKTKMLDKDEKLELIAKEEQLIPFLQNEYASLKIINTANEDEFNEIIKDYEISLDELYEAKKKGERIARFA